jgi:hypothetical protein
MTVPYSAFLSSSALTATGHKRMRAKTVNKTRDIELRRFRLCLLVGRRAERGIMMKREREREVYVEANTKSWVGVLSIIQGKMLLLTLSLAETTSDKAVAVTPLAFGTFRPVVGLQVSGLKASSSSSSVTLVGSYCRYFKSFCLLLDIYSIAFLLSANVRPVGICFVGFRLRPMSFKSRFTGPHPSFNETSSGLTKQTFHARPRHLTVSANCQQPRLAVRGASTAVDNHPRVSFV